MHEALQEEEEKGKPKEGFLEGTLDLGQSAKLGRRKKPAPAFLRHLGQNLPAVQGGILRGKSPYGNPALPIQNHPFPFQDPLVPVLAYGKEGLLYPR